MSTLVGTLLQQALAGTFTNGLWQERARDAIKAPYGVFNYFGQEDWYVANKNAKQNRTVQIDCYGSTVAEAEALADAVIARLEAENGVDASPTTFTGSCTSRQSLGTDPEVRLPRVMVDISFWYRP